jgi:hypothetical protein
MLLDDVFALLGQKFLLHHDLDDVVCELILGKISGVVEYWHEEKVQKIVGSFPCRVCELLMLVELALLDCPLQCAL